MSRRLGTAELREITRQEEAWARAGVGDFAEDDTQAALAQFVSRGLLMVTQNADQALSQLGAASLGRILGPLWPWSQSRVLSRILTST